MYFDVKACGKRIQSLRDSLGYSQDDFSEKVHIGRTHLAKIEIGTKTPSIDVLVEIADFGNVSLDYLILGIENSDKIMQKHVEDAIQELNVIKRLLI